MFEPRKPLEFKPIEPKKPLPPYTGISQYVNLFETTPPPPAKPIQTIEEIKQQKREKAIKLHKEKVELLAVDWDPHNNPKATEQVLRFITRLYLNNLRLGFLIETPI